MFPFKTALVGLSMAATLSSAAQAYEERFGNGGTWVTIPDSSTDGSVGTRQSADHPGIRGDAGAATASRFVASPSSKHRLTKAPNSVR